MRTADTLGGVWTYALGLARELGARGVEVVLAALGPTISAAQRREAEAIRGLTPVTRRTRLDGRPVA